MISHCNIFQERQTLEQIYCLDQVDMKKDNKNINIFKYSLQIRRQTMDAEIVIFRKQQVVKETTVLEEIQKNNTKEQEI